MPSSPSWWPDAAGYEIYVPSFHDADGDGWGDTEADLVALVQAAGRRGMRVLLDLVVNHTSDRHPWFQDALTGRDAEHRDYYHWRDPAPDGGPPNALTQLFGGSAWRFDEASGQFFLHLFAPEQPDLNWADPRVADEVDAVLRHWLDRGVAGFRVDVAHSMAKHPDLLDDPRLDPRPPAPGGRPGKPREWDFVEHRHDLGQPAALEIHRRWRRITGPRDALLLGEINLRDPLALARYAGHDGLDAAFAFAMAETSRDPPALLATVRGHAGASRALAWAHASHDRSRPVTRFGGGATGRRRALVLQTLTVGLPAVPLLYQGEELGLEDADLDRATVQDPLARHTPGAFARDVVRSPMPWAPGPGLGFTTAERAWMPFGERAAADTAAVQARDPDSPLRRHRALLASRRRHADLRRGDGPHWLELPEPLAAYRRGTALVVANLGPDAASPALPGGPGPSRSRPIPPPARTGCPANPPPSWPEWRSVRLMPCFVAVLALLSPRLALIAMALFTDVLSRAFDSWVLPLLGFFILPWTTLAYGVMWDVGTHEVQGFEWFVVVVAFLADLGSLGGASRSRR